MRSDRGQSWEFWHARGEEENSGKDTDQISRAHRESENCGDKRPSCSQNGGELHRILYRRVCFTVSYWCVRTTALNTREWWTVLVTSECTNESLGLPSKTKATHKTVSVHTLAPGASWYLKRMDWGWACRRKKTEKSQLRRVNAVGFSF